MSKSVVERFVKKATKGSKHVRKAAVNGYYAALQVCGAAVPFTPKDGTAYANYAVGESINYLRQVEADARADAALVASLMDRPQGSLSPEKKDELRRALLDGGKEAPADGTTRKEIVAGPDDRDHECCCEQPVEDVTMVTAQAHMPDDEQPATTEQSVVPGQEPVPSQTGAPGQGETGSQAELGIKPDCGQQAPTCGSTCCGTAGELAQEKQHVTAPNQAVRKPQPADDPAPDAEAEDCCDDDCDGCCEACYYAAEADRRAVLLELVGSTQQEIIELVKVPGISDERLTLAVEAVNGLAEVAIEALFPNTAERHVYHHLCLPEDWERVECEDEEDGDDENAYVGV